MKKTSLILVLIILSLLSLCSCNETESASKSTSDYEFVSDGYTLKIGDDFSGLADKMNFREVESSPSCADQGYDKIYSFVGFEIHTEPDGNQDLISAITLLDDSVKTKEGIAVGHSKENVISAYGSGTETNGNLIYETDNMQLVFFIKNDVVSKIRYQSK